MLEVKDLKVAYGRVRAVKGISFKVEQGQVVTRRYQWGWQDHHAPHDLWLDQARVWRDLVRGSTD
jgi:hypothetical protein